MLLPDYRESGNSIRVLFDPSGTPSVLHHSSCAMESKLVGRVLPSVAVGDVPESFSFHKLA